MASDRTGELRALAQSIADALPPIVEEVVLTGSVSRGVADRLSDIEMLVVTTEQLALAECFAHARNAGLVSLDSWGPQGTDVSRVFGYRDAVPVELVWWSRARAELAIARLLDGTESASGDALVHGVPLRTRGLLSEWQSRLSPYPENLAAVGIEEAALTWGGFAPAGLLTLTRPGERLALLERLVDDAGRVLRIVYALNRVWPPTSKRLVDRVDDLEVVPPDVAERIEDALTEPDPVRAVLLMSELQRDTVELASDGPNVVRARRWLDEAIALLKAQTSTTRPS